jgi:hypothetical protein
VRRDLGVNQSRQTALDEVMPRSENAGEKICKKGLDNSGNIEGNTKPLFTRALPTGAATPSPPAAPRTPGAALPAGEKSGSVI